jgi:phosphoribosylaminoimidazole-succinocarboxamide synthase
MERRQELYRGKTKAVFATSDENAVILQNFDALTKFDTPELTAQM